MYVLYQYSLYLYKLSYIIKSRELLASIDFCEFNGKKLSIFFCLNQVYEGNIKGML